MLAMYIVSMPNKYVPIKFLYISVNQSPFSMLNSLVGFLISITRTKKTIFPISTVYKFKLEFIHS